MDIKRTQSRAKACTVVGLPLIVLISLVAIVGTGCATTRLLPPLSRAERRPIEDAYFPLAIGVKRYKSPVYSRNLVRDLRKTELFKRVDHLHRFSIPPDVIAEVAERYTSDAGIPLFYLMSFGIIAQGAKEKHGSVFVLRRNTAEADELLVEFRGEGYTILGYLGMPLALHPNWVIYTGDLPGPDILFGDPRINKRFVQHLSLAILKHAQELNEWALGIEQD